MFSIQNETRPHSDRAVVPGDSPRLGLDVPRDPLLDPDDPAADHGRIASHHRWQRPAGVVLVARLSAHAPAMASERHRRHLLLSTRARFAALGGTRRPVGRGCAPDGRGAGVGRCVVSDFRRSIAIEPVRYGRTVHWRHRSGDARRPSCSDRRLAADHRFVRRRVQRNRVVRRDDLFAHGAAASHADHVRSDVATVWRRAAHRRVVRHRQRTDVPLRKRVAGVGGRAHLPDRLRRAHVCRLYVSSDALAAGARRHARLHEPADRCRPRRDHRRRACYRPDHRRCGCDSHRDPPRPARHSRIARL